MTLKTAGRETQLKLIWKSNSRRFKNDDYESDIDHKINKVLCILFYINVKKQYIICNVIQYCVVSGTLVRLLENEILHSILLR